MMYRIQNGRFVFTVCPLNRSRQSVSFHDGIVWAFVQKLAAACAAETG